MQAPAEGDDLRSAGEHDEMDRPAHPTRQFVKEVNGQGFVFDVRLLSHLVIKRVNLLRV